jgi:hypothetical protein
MNFEELTRAIAEASVLAKSLSAADTTDTKKIAAAAKDGEATGGVNGPGDDDEDDETGGEGGKGKGGGDGDEDDLDEAQLGKSFRLTLEDGTEMEAFDGSQMVEALSAQIKATKTARAQDNEMYMKSFGSTLDLVKSLTTAVAESQKDIESLKAENGTLQKSLKALGTQGRGRVSTVTVLDKPNATPRQESAPTRPEILAKAMSALSARRITGEEATRVEAALNAGAVPQKEVLERIFAA